MSAANGRGSRRHGKANASPGCGRCGSATTRCRRPTSRSSRCCATCCKFIRTVRRRAAIIQDHPDPSGNRLCHGLADDYAEGAAVAGDELTRIEVARLDFPILRTQEDLSTVATALARPHERLWQAPRLRVSLDEDEDRN